MKQKANLFGMLCPLIMNALAEKKCRFLDQDLNYAIELAFVILVRIHMCLKYFKSTSIQHFEHCNQQLSNPICQNCDGSIKILLDVGNSATCSVIIIHSSR